MPYRVLPGSSPFTQVYVVDAAGNGDYATIQAAINAAHAQEPSANERWVVMIAPGAYAEQLTLYDYVDVAGIAPAPAVFITPSSGRPVAVAANCTLSNLVLRGSTSPLVDVDVAGVALGLENCLIDQDSASVQGIHADQGSLSLRRCRLRAADVVLKVVSGDVLAYECLFELANETPGAGALPVVQIAGAGNLRLERCTVQNLSGDLGGGGGEALKWAGGATGVLRALDCVLKKSGSVSYTIDAADGGMSAAIMGCLMTHTYNSSKISGVIAGNDVGDFS